MSQDYEFRTTIAQHSAWIFILLFAASIIMFGVTVHMLIPDTPREWNFGTMPDAPGESVYSTGTPGMEGNPPRQLEKLPEIEETGD